MKAEDACFGRGRLKYSGLTLNQYGVASPCPDLVNLLYVADSDDARAVFAMYCVNRVFGVASGSDPTFAFSDDPLGLEVV
ncbi:hypothetical protein HMPREF9418_0786 [Neisseria macacae ATCC 33926]|uniref:Uncharacterized protein n=1 Tax=Neisseria macacae ATCC 33926 TaxID=997348 RepID=A0AA36XLV3_9NEIS|nr:hypothetical protein HMPREF9418_0786 [Neisseria macacae ATCC 33926]